MGGRLRGLREGLAVAAGQTTPADITLLGVGAVSGTVRRQGQPAAATVYLYGLSPVGGFQSLSTSNGSFSFSEVPVGPFRVAAVGAGAQAGRGETTGAVNQHGDQQTADVELFALTLPLSLRDGNDLGWQIHSDGSLRHGPMLDAAGASPRLSLVANGQAHVFANASGNLGGSGQNGREVVLHASDLAGLEVARRVYVPVDGYFIRHLDVLSNPGSQDLTVDVVREVVLGGAPSLLATATCAASSSCAGSEPLLPGDTWVVVDDANPTDIYESGYPDGQFAPSALAVWGAGGTAPSEASLVAEGDRRRLTWRWNAVTVPAGGRVAFLQLFSAQADRVRGQAAAERLVLGPGEALAGLSAEEAEAILNFDVPPDLSSAALPLPGNDGRVLGTLYAFDGATLAGGDSVRFRSRSPFFGRPLTAGVSSSTSAFSIQASPTTGTLIPRTDFDLLASLTAVGATMTTSASGSFQPESPQVRRDLAFAGTGLVQGTASYPGGPLPGTRIWLRQGSAYEYLTARADGSYRFPVLAPGTYQLEATHPAGSPSLLHTVLVTADAGTTQPLDFPAVGGLDVRLFDSTGAGAPGTVTLTGDGVSRTVDVAAGQVAELRDVPAGTYTLAARDARSQLVLTRPGVVVEVGPAGSESFTFPVVGQVNVVATVGAQRLANAPVWIKADARDPDFVHAGSTNASGERLIGGVPGTHVRVRVTIPRPISSASWPRAT